jgi:hypothetical protein
LLKVSGKSLPIIDQTEDYCRTSFTTVEYQKLATFPPLTL